MMFDALKTQTACHGQKAIARFAREDGNITTLALIMFVLMVSVGGLAVDLMRYEQIRTSLSQSLDRCTLAGASLTQSMDPEAVCRDYVAKAGHTDDLTDVTVTEGLNFREVSADGMAFEKPFFAHMVGIDNFDIPAASVAEQRVSDIEIAMVLDISGSMVNTPSRIANLKTAGKEFVQSVLASDAEQRTSILIVPYNGQVNLGPALRSKFNVTMHSGRAGVDCVDLPLSSYSNSTMSRVSPIPATAHADTYSSTSQATGFVALNDTNSATPTNTNRWCPLNADGTAMAQNYVRMPNNNIGTLQAQIDGLTAIGATSINAGMKWGLALLDPSARSIYNEMNPSVIPAVFAGRPFEYTADNDPTPTSMKVIVLMTDGEHWPEERVNDAFKSGNADIWRGNSDGNYSRLDSTRIDTSTATKLCDSRPFWVPHLGAWHARPWNGTTPPTTPASATCYTNTITTTTTGITRQTWPQVWANLRLSYVAWQFYARGMTVAGGNGTGKNAASTTPRTTHYNNTMTAFRTVTDVNVMNSQLDALCDRARDNNVIVFGIAFEAPANGQAVISSCATDNSHYFQTTGTELRTAFRAIASQISQLRLTQ